MASTCIYTREKSDTCSGELPFNESGIVEPPLGTAPFLLGTAHKQAQMLPVAAKSIMLFLLKD